MDANIRLGSVKYYASQNEGSGLHDSEEGVLKYHSDQPIELSPEFSRKYLNNSIKSDGNGTLIIGPNRGGDIIINFPLTNDVGKNGFLEIHPTKDAPLTKIFNNLFYIFSLTIDSTPSLEKAKAFSSEYDSFYEVSNILDFATEISHELSRQAKCSVGFRYAEVDYKTEKYKIFEDGDTNEGVNYVEAAFEAVFNKNTKHKHKYQNEIRIVFWLRSEKSAQILLQNQDFIDLKPASIFKNLSSYDSWLNND